jgi:hypothetical protein
MTTSGLNAADREDPHTSSFRTSCHRLLVVIDLGAILAKARAEVSGVVALFSAAALLGWLSHGLRSPGHR